MSDFYADDKKQAMPSEWQNWADQHQTAENLDQNTKDQYFGVNQGSEHQEPGEEVAAADIPQGDLQEGTA